MPLLRPCFGKNIKTRDLRARGLRQYHFSAASLFAGEGELVAVGIFESAAGAPFFFFGLLGELDAFGFEDFGGGEEVVAPEGDGLELADAVFMALGGEEGEAGWRTGNGELDPALLLGVRLIGDDFEAEGFGEELQGNVLIADGDADEFDAANHAVLLWKTFEKITCGARGFQSGGVAIGMVEIAMMISLEDYVVDVLRRDLVGHDRRPACCWVYVW